MKYFLMFFWGEKYSLIFLYFNWNNFLILREDWKIFFESWDFWFWNWTKCFLGSLIIFRVISETWDWGGLDVGWFFVWKMFLVRIGFKVGVFLVVKLVSWKTKNGLKLNLMIRFFVLMKKDVTNFWGWDGISKKLIGKL